MTKENNQLPNSGLAIVGLVLGILALVSSWIPIFNNLSFFVGLICWSFALIVLVGVLRGKKGGRGLAIAAVVINVVAIAVVLASQSAYSTAIDEAVSGPSVTATSDAAATANDSALTVGSSATLSNGLTVSVDSITADLVNYDGSKVTGVQVTYTNNGSETASFNVYDWKCENANGVQTSNAYYSSAENALNSGALAVGGTVTGMLYFDGDIVKVHYFSSIISSNPTATWGLA